MSGEGKRLGFGETVGILGAGIEPSILGVGVHLVRWQRSGPDETPPALPPAPVLQEHVLVGSTRGLGFRV